MHPRTYIFNGESGLQSPFTMNKTYGSCPDLTVEDEEELWDSFPEDERDAVEEAAHTVGAAARRVRFAALAGRRLSTRFEGFGDHSRKYFRHSRRVTHLLGL